MSRSDTDPTRFGKQDPDPAIVVKSDPTKIRVWPDPDPHPWFELLGDPEITANLYCNFEYLYWEGCAICRIYLR